MIFQELSEYTAKGLEFRIGISGSQEKMTVSIVPVGKQAYPPLNFTGTAEEIDTEFLPEVQRAFGEAIGFMSNAAGYAEKVKEASEEKKTTPPASTAKPETKKPDPKKPEEKKKTEVKKSEKVVPPSFLAKKKEETTTQPATTTQPVDTTTGLSFEPIMPANQPEQFDAPPITIDHTDEPAKIEWRDTTSDAYNGQQAEVKDEADDDDGQPTLF